MKYMTEQMIDEYSRMLLSWAYKKLGQKEKAQELVQEVWLQVFRAMERNEANGIPVSKMENFIWKIAHFVWCHYLRKHVSYGMDVSVDDLELADERDFVQELAENEEKEALIAYMRKRIVSLNNLQREVLVLFYIEGKSQKEIAARLNITQSMVKWYLFDTRKRLKEELTSMKETNFVYRPRKLNVGINGWVGVAYPDTFAIRDSLSKQNICIACYKEPRTLEELSDMLGIPQAYIEKDVEWLVAHEFMSKQKNRYATLFMIQTAQDAQEVNAVYVKHKKTLADVIVQGLCEKEQEIRQIGFHGSAQPFDKLLWLLIYRFCNYLKKPCERPEAPVRPDGGKYFPIGADWTDYADIEKVLDTSGWAYNGSMNNDNFWWFGLYNFGTSEIEAMINYYEPEWKELHEVLCVLIHSGFDITYFDEEQKVALAKLVQKGFAKMDGMKAYPAFCVFTKEQYKQLEETIYEPLAKKLEQEVWKVAQELKELCRNKAPIQLKASSELFAYMAMGDIGYLTTIFAFQDGRLYVPKDSHDGEFLTLMYIKK